MKKYVVTVIITVLTIFAGGADVALARGTVAVPTPSMPAQLSGWAGEAGMASYYGPAYDGHRSADGQTFNQEALTAAHPWLPFGTKVKVILPATGRSVIVTITDRMWRPGRIVDLSVAAARQLGMLQKGIALVTLLPA